MDFQLKSKIETILFISAKPVSFKKIAEILGVDNNAVKEVVEQLQNEYNKDSRGFRIIFNENEAEMVSAPENKNIVEKMQKTEIQGELSRAAMEVLAIVAYKGPISKFQAEEIRGVNCSYTFRNLLMRGLIEKAGKDKDGSVLYKISLDLLKKFGVEKIKSLKDSSDF